MKILSGYYRHDVINLLVKSRGNIGVELGIAEGIFLKRMIDSKKFSMYIGIDAYANDGTHTTLQYKRALKLCGILEDYKILRMQFKESLDLFEDESLDFIYVDGYAHTGEEQGQTICDWYPKLRIGGVMAGDDYHNDWPLVKNAVDYFVKSIEGELFITDKIENIRYCSFPTWAVIKKFNKSITYPPKELFLKKYLK
jgi:hypothetical protein